MDEPLSGDVFRMAGHPCQVSANGIRLTEHGSRTPCWCTSTKLCCPPDDHRFEETRWGSFAADILVGIVWGKSHPVVACVYRGVCVNLNGVIPASVRPDS